MANKSLSTIAIVICVLFSACQKHASTVDSHGNTIALNNLQGKWLIVNYWATWCGHCKTELRELDKFYQAHKNNVMVLGVNFDALPATKLNTLQTKMKIHFPLASHFPIDQFGVGDIDNLPRTFIFSPDGKLQQTLYGPQTKKALTHAVQSTKTNQS